MPSKSKVYLGSKFMPETIEQGMTAFRARLPTAPLVTTGYDFSTVLPGDESWTLDSADEFYAQYRGDIKTGTIRAIHGPAARFAVQFSREHEPGEARVYALLPTRADVEAVFEVFEAAVVASRIPYRPTVFIGHGHAQSWRELKDYLRERQHILVQDFNTDPTAGYGVTEVLERLVRTSSLALLVHTAEDEQPDKAVRARENVVHETGLFQGALGFPRAIIVREQSCEPFSNVAGLQEVRFGATIKEAFSEIADIVNREFPHRTPA
jgi:hypothetical protein